MQFRADVHISSRCAWLGCLLVWPRVYSSYACAYIRTHERNVLPHRLTCAISYRIFYGRPYRPRHIMAYANWVDKKNRFQRRTKVVVEMRKISTLRDSAYADAQDGAFFSPRITTFLVFCFARLPPPPFPSASTTSAMHVTSQRRNALFSCYARMSLTLFLREISAGISLHSVDMAMLM